MTATAVGCVRSHRPATPPPDHHRFVPALPPAIYQTIRWWDVGAPTVPYSWFADSRVVEKEEAISRRRARSLTGFIRDGIGLGGSAGEPSARNVLRTAGVGLRETRRYGVRAVSMIDPREAEQVSRRGRDAVSGRVSLWCAILRRMYRYTLISGIFGRGGREEVRGKMSASVPVFQFSGQR